MKNLGFIKNIITMATNKKEQPAKLVESPLKQSKTQPLLQPIGEAETVVEEYDYYPVQQGDTVAKIAYKFDMRYLH